LAFLTRTGSIPTQRKDTTAWRPNIEREANINIVAMLAGELDVAKTLLGDKAFSDGLFPYFYEEAGGWGLSQKKLPKNHGHVKTICTTTAKRASNFSFLNLLIFSDEEV
jgi:hypothetical protein